MWRTAVRPKWLALLAVVVAVIVSFGILGMWQLNVARSEAHAEQVERVKALPQAELTQILQPHTAMTEDDAGRTVTVEGTYAADRQLLVADRRLGEQTGFWVLTPLVVEPGGAWLPVIRGFVTDPAQAPAPPSGPIRLEGMLAPGEAAPNDPRPLPDGQIQAVDLADLVNAWPADLYNAMLFTTAQTPPDAAPATPIPPPDLAPEGFAWRNLAYALQWWCFAAFALYMWWRMVREEHEREARLRAVADDPSPADVDHRPEIPETLHDTRSEETPA